MELNRERLAQLFIELCETESPSKREKSIALRLRELCKKEFPEAEITEDDSAAETGSDTGNLVVRFGGDNSLDPIFLNCHMDTVLPCAGVKVERRDDTFFSAGDTILGGDDKAGIAIIIEAMRTLKENKLAHAPVELVFTTCEEVGLLGAKAFNTSLLRARYGYALDSTGVDLAVIGAPAANHITVEITGAAAHAGLHPERGINAIQIASQAIAKLQLGRLDEESTANIGIVKGGQATNIIPEQVKIEGEVRSHSAEKLARHTQEMESIFLESVASWQAPADSQVPDNITPYCIFSSVEEYPAMKLAIEAPVVEHIRQAGGKMGRPIDFIVAGGGSDANIFNGKGIPTAIIGIGMDHVHSTEESITLDDMIRTAELVVSLLTP